ncbi:MAG: hypothetical protein QNJ92_04845 [Alphaproteobacteria bacterium]|nr:hypothetical protein [Alphaproteobacteria bacterium]
MRATVVSKRTWLAAGFDAAPVRLTQVKDSPATGADADAIASSWAGLVMGMRRASSPNRRGRAAAGEGGTQGIGSSDPTSESTAYLLPFMEAIDVALLPSRTGWQPQIHYHRPDLRSLVAGQTVRDARDCLGLVHSVCGYAHVAAFTEAVEQINGAEPVGNARAAARNLHVLIETASAHSQRVALELAPACGQPPCITELRSVLDATSAAKIAVGMDDFDGPIDPDKRALTGALERLNEGLTGVLKAVPAAPPASSLEVMPAAVRAAVIEGWERPWVFTDDFLAQSIRLAEKLQTEPARKAGANADGVGHGTSITSRGVLRYDVEVEQERVIACRSSTPTERLAAADGPLVRQLSQLPADDRALAMARFVILAADPCVPTTVRVGEAAHA